MGTINLDVNIKKHIRTFIGPDGKHYEGGPEAYYNKVGNNKVPTGQADSVPAGESQEKAKN